MKKPKALLSSLFALCSFCGCASMSSDPECPTEDVALTAGADFSVQTTRYRGVSESRKTLILLPPTGGANYIDRRYAEKFCEAGYHVIIVKSWTDMDEKTTDLELHQRLYARSQRAITTVVAEIKTPFIGMLGTSLGGTFASLAAHLQPRLNAVFVITAGIPIPEVIVTSDQKSMKDLKFARMARYQYLSEDEYLRALTRNFTLDPTLLGSGFKNKTLGMAMTTEDETVPYKNQKKLAELWDPSLVLTYKNGHFWGIIKSWWFSDDRILAFFEDSYRQQQENSEATK